ncbi:hypothetical protein ACQRIU_001878 [Beauveria bassiana]
MRAMKEMGFKGTILTYAKETVFDHKNKEEFGLGMNMIPTNGASSTECPYITLWKQGTLDTVKLLGEQDQLAVKITGAGPRVTCALADDSQPPQQFLDAVDEIVRDCKARGAKILIDAESQRFQAGIMRIGLDLMRKYNRDGYAVVYNTYQAYLKSTPTSLTCHLASALDDSFTLGLKVVRGAYLATDERSLIHDTKEETDEAYDSIAAGALQQQLLGFGGDEDGRSFPTRIEDILYGKTASGQGHAHILRALPNIAASVGQSFTALAVPTECSIPEQRIALAERIFARVGQTARVPPSLMEAATAVAGSTPAMFAVLCDALIDASVAVGMPRQMAEAMVVQSMRGSAELLQSGGMSCATLRDAGTSPEGCTMAAIMAMEERGVRGAFGRALREAVTAARRMDSVQHVNDTWR